MKTNLLIKFAAILLMVSTLPLQSSSLENSLLWRISGNGLATPSYLFGTHHLVAISFLDTVNGLREAFERTEQTVGELDMNNMAGMHLQMMQHALMPEGITYESLLNDEDFELLDNELSRFSGMGISMGRFKPAMLAQVITLSIYQRYYPEVATGENIDFYFQQKARQRSRPVVGLETIEDQIFALLKVNSIERQAELLMCLIRHPELLKSTLSRLHEAYFAHDINALYELWAGDDTYNPCPSTDEEKNALNKDRNLRWLEQLPAIMSEQSSFIAVGALHLPGEYGLIKGLRRLGFTVEAVL